MPKTTRTRVSTIPANETPAESFKRLATARTQKTLEMLRKLGQCGDKSNYSYTVEDAKKIFKTIRKEVDEIEKKFIPTVVKPKGEFSL